jgi:hypothetical protein
MQQQEQQVPAAVDLSCSRQKVISREQLAPCRMAQLQYINLIKAVRDLHRS